MIFLAVFIGLATAYVATAITYYEILGVSRFASEDEIKKSYRKLAKDYHPDRVLPKNAVENGQKHLRLMQKVNLAYETLKDPTLRQEYNNKMNYYEVLGLHRTASEMEIKIAYLRMMRDFNLDLGTNDEEKNERLTVLSQIRMAHETLSDLHRRQDYDNSLPLEEIENDFWHNTSLFVYFRDINTIQQMVVAAVILILSIYYLALYLVPYLAHKYEIRNMRMNALQATRELLLHSPTVVGPEVKPTTSNTTSLPPSRVFAPSFKLQVRKESDVQTTKPESQTESLTEPTSAPTTQTSISATSAPPQQPFQLKLRPTTAKPASDVKKTTVPSSSQPRTTTRSSFLPPVTEQHSTTRPQWGTFTAASENERALIAQQNLEYELCVMEDLRKAEEARSARAKEEALEKERMLRISKLPTEPLLDEEDIITIAFRFKGFTSCQEKTLRRFRSFETVNHVLDFVESVTMHPMDRTIRVEAPYPLTKWTRGMQHLSLKEMACGKNCVLNVSLEEIH